MEPQMAAPPGLPELPFAANSEAKKARFRLECGGRMVSLLTQWRASGSAPG